MAGKTSLSRRSHLGPVLALALIGACLFLQACDSGSSLASPPASSQGNTPPPPPPPPPPATPTVTIDSPANNAVVTALKAMGIAEDDIQTTSLTLTPVYDYDTSPARLVGYQASNQVTVTVRDITQTGPVIDAATAAADGSNGAQYDVRWRTFRR